MEIGKLISGSIYIHQESLFLVDEEITELILNAKSIAHDADHANVFRVDRNDKSVSLLYYPSFFSQPFPELLESWRVYIDEQRSVYRNFKDSTNPPILHRKELLIPSTHESYALFSNLTRQAEQIGLFTNKLTIGFKNNWDAEIIKYGYWLDGHTFQLMGNDIDSQSLETINSDEIERHRTALSRYALSAPAQSLAKNGLIRDDLTYFDYGCGRGDDIAALKSLNIQAFGWDPHFANETEKIASDIVNLGFVLNVIENFDERIQALQGAYDLSNKLLVISVMLYTNTPPTGKPYRDGYLSQRNTFQKYFTQSELKEFIENVLDVEAIPVAPGIVYVFRDKQTEQEYLYKRQRNNHTLKLLGYRKVKQEKEEKQRRVTKSESIRVEHEDLINNIWNLFIDLGRPCEPHESTDSAMAIEVFGSWPKAVRFVLTHHDVADLELAISSHKDDLLVFLALQQFSKRKSYKSLEPHLKREIKFHFGDYQTAITNASLVLRKIGYPAELNNACINAQIKGLGYYVDSDYLQLDTSLIEQLPPLLRIYIGCATAIYGSLDNVDLIKLHIRSGKISLMRYDDFRSSPLPRLIERIKINLKTQDIDIFNYGSEFAPTLLYFKSKYINENFPFYAEQLIFDQDLKKLNIVSEDEFSPSEENFYSRLNIIRKEIQGSQLKSSRINN